MRIAVNPEFLREGSAVTDYFNKNNTFTTGLQLEPGLWGTDQGKA